MNSQDQQHSAHVHCDCCGSCMDMPISILIDIEIDIRQSGVEAPGLICDVCL